MIRMVLFALGFLAITVALVVLQPGADRGGPEGPLPEPVTRAEPRLPSGLAQPEGSSGALFSDVPFARQPEPEPEPFAHTALGLPPTPLAKGGDMDDQEMRRMTWDTLSSLNQATGRESAPGQPGSLLHTIVRRSLDGVPAGVAPVVNNSTGTYVVQSGDSLVSIAERVYGDVNMTGPLFAANQDLLSRPDDLRPGQTLILPVR